MNLKLHIMIIFSLKKNKIVKMNLKILILIICKTFFTRVLGFKKKILKKMILKKKILKKIILKKKLNKNDKFNKIYLLSN